MSGKIWQRFVFVSALAFIPIKTVQGATAPLIVQKCAVWLGIVETKAPFSEKYIIPEGAIKKSEVPAAGFRTLNTTLFSIKGVVKGVHGKDGLLIEKRAGWHDQRISTEGSLTQDLRLYPVILGKKAAQYFGYQHLNETQMVVPTFQELNAAIDDFNKGLTPDDLRRIKIRAYGSGDIAINFEEFVLRFVNNSEIPISYLGKQFYHDISVHGLEGFFLNNELIDVLQKRALLWFDFRNTAKLKLNADDFEKWDRAVLRSFATQIDNLGMASELFSANEDEEQLKNSARKFMEKSKLSSQEREEVGLRSAIVHGYDTKEKFEQSLREKFPALIETPDGFFSNILKETVSVKDQNIMLAHLSEYLENAKQSKNELFKELSFDFLVQAKVLHGMKNISNVFSRRAVFKNLEISKPYWGRLERLKIISAQSSNTNQ